MATTTTKTQKDRLITVFKTGKNFTLNQISTRLNAPVPSVRRLISELRREGYAIYKNEKPGQTSSVYRLGTPSREMVAIAAKVAGSEIFSRN